MPPVRTGDQGGRTPRKPVVDDGPDSGDLDAIKELIESPGYSLVRARVTHEIERLRGELEGDLDSEKSAKLRGQIKAYRTLLQIPEILKAELSGQLGKKR